MSHPLDNATADQIASLRGVVNKKIVQMAALMVESAGLLFDHEDWQELGALVEIVVENINAAAASITSFQSDEPDFS